MKVTRKNKGRMVGDELRESNKGERGVQTKGKLQAISALSLTE